MSKKLDDIAKDIGDIKLGQLDHTKQLIEYNTLLGVHIKRTELLEQRIIPVEDHVKFIQKLAKLSAVLIGVLGSLIAILKFFLRH